MGGLLDLGVGAIQQVATPKLGSEESKFPHSMLLRVGENGVKVGVLYAE